MPLLKQAISLNPNHLKANQLLAEIYLADGKLDEAVTLLETLYKYKPEVAGPRLVQAWLALAQNASGEAEKLVLYEKILEIEPQQTDAVQKIKRVKKRAQTEDDYAKALGLIEQNEREKGILACHPKHAL